MKIILDECLPTQLRHQFENHEVFTARYLGYSGASDQSLVDLISGEFDVLVTCDRNLIWQTSPKGRIVAIILMCVPSTKLSDLKPLMPEVLRQLENIHPGDFIVVE